MTTSSGSAIQIRHMGDTAFSIRLGGHEMVVDLPLEAGGGDVGPSPTPLLVASLAAGVAFFGRGFLHAHGLPDRVNVTARWWSQLTPMRVGRVEVSVEAPGLPASKLGAFSRAIEHCTVHNTLHDPPEVLFEVVTSEGEVPSHGQRLDQRAPGDLVDDALGLAEQGQ
jgi:putative redox protein